MSATPVGDHAARWLAESTRLRAYLVTHPAPLDDDGCASYRASLPSCPSLGRVEFEQALFDAYADAIPLPYLEVS